MNKIVQRIRARRDSISLQRAIDNASTPAMRDELITIAQRHISG